MAKSNTKSKINLYVKIVTAQWLERFPLGKSVPLGASSLLDWSVAQLRRGGLRMFKRLTHDERIAIIDSVSSLLVSAETPNLAARTADWFALDSGMLYEWSEDKIAELVQKLEGISPHESLGLLLWAKGFWLTEGDDKEAYADDTSYLKTLAL